MFAKAVIAAGMAATLAVAQAAEAPAPFDAAKVTLQWGVRIPMRDGVRLGATLYAPKEQKAPDSARVALRCLKTSLAMTTARASPSFRTGHGAA